MHIKNKLTIRNGKWVNRCQCHCGNGSNLQRAQNKFEVRTMVVFTVSEFSAWNLARKDRKVQKKAIITSMCELVGRSLSQQAVPRKNKSNIFVAHIWMLLTRHNVRIFKLSLQRFCNKRQADTPSFFLWFFHLFKKRISSGKCSLIPVQRLRPFWDTWESPLPSFLLVSARFAFSLSILVCYVFLIILSRRCGRCTGNCTGRSWYHAEWY